MRELIQQNPAEWLAIGGFVIGAAFGYVVFRTNFCTMGSISDFMSFGDYRRFRAWVLAGAITMIGAQLLYAGGTIPLGKTMYLGARLNWLGNILGGLLFGYGMVFAGGCASKNLARAGGGDLRSLVVLIVMGLVAYMTIGGIIGPARSWLEQTTSVNLAQLGGMELASQSAGEILGGLSGLGTARGTLLATALIAGAMLVYVFRDASFRASPIHIASGVGVGLCAVAGWALTGLAFDELADKPVSPISLTYVRPTADTIEWLERFTAGMVPGFGVATVLGALAGACIAALSMGRFHLATFASVGDTRRGLYGATLMGVGGVMALGCTVGQAITGISTLAVGSFLTFAAIVAGGMAGMKRMEAILINEA